MYTLWEKLTTIEDVLLGEVHYVVKYLYEHYSTPIQQIHTMFSERADILKVDCLKPISTDASRFRLFVDSNTTFDTLSTYIGFIFHSYHGKTECIFNRQLYKRGDIILVDVKTIAFSSNILESDCRNSQIYTSLYRLFLNSYFPKLNFEQIVGQGIFYEKEKWSFNILNLHSKSHANLFSIDEQNFIEMSILTWTKKLFNNQIPVYLNAEKMLEDQLKYVKALLKTQRIELKEKEIWSLEKFDLAEKIFQYEIQDQIDSLVYNRNIFNTFNNFHEQMKNPNSDKFKLTIEIFEHHRWMIKAQPSQPYFQSIWKQLQLIENWFQQNEYQSIVNFLQLNSCHSIESLFSLSYPSFLNRFGIHPQSDRFDPKSNYIGLLVYLYKDQEKFSINEHSYERGQLLIRKKDSILKTSSNFDSLFVHEYFYELIFKEKSTENFYGIGFIYEQGKWRYDILVYSGIHGIHSIYDRRGENSMKITLIEECCIDLIVLLKYMNNKWLENIGYMYKIDELRNMGREFFREKIEFIEDLYEKNKKILKDLNELCPTMFKNLIQQYKPEVIKRKSTLSIQFSDPKCLSTQKSEEIKPNLFNSDHDSSSIKDNLFRSVLSDPSSSSIPTKVPKKSSASKVPKSFPTSLGSKPRAKSQDSSHSSREQIETKKASKKSKEIRNFYQLWQELCDAEQKLLGHSTLNNFIKYLETKEYLNYDQIKSFDPPVEYSQEYHLLAEIKIDAQLKSIKELYDFKRKQIDYRQEKKHFDELIKEFSNYYKIQIEYARRYFK